MDFDYELLDGKRVDSLLAVGTARDSSGGYSCERLAMRLGDSELLISVDEDTDQVLLRLEVAGMTAMPGADGWSACEPLQRFVGKDLGWCWIAHNYRGYRDALMLSFSGITPDVALLGMGSTLWIYELRRL